MNTTKTIAALFDFDGVIMDTETQYTVFWNEQGLKHLNEEDFGRRIKGQTLTQIYEKYFPTLPEAQREITANISIPRRKQSGAGLERANISPVRIRSTIPLNSG